MVTTLPCPLPFATTWGQPGNGQTKVYCGIYSTEPSQHHTRVAQAYDREIPPLGPGIMPLSNTSNTPTVLDSSSVLFPCGDWFLQTLPKLVFVDRLTSAGCREHVVDEGKPRSHC